MRANHEMNVAVQSSVSDRPDGCSHAFALRLLLTYSLRRLQRRCRGVCGVVFVASGLHRSCQTCTCVAANTGTHSFTHLHTAQMYETALEHDGCHIMTLCCYADMLAGKYNPLRESRVCLMFRMMMIMLVDPLHHRVMMCSMNDLIHSLSEFLLQSVSSTIILLACVASMLLSLT